MDSTERFRIEVRETLSRLVDVEAENSDEAVEKVRRDYYDGKIVLTADDFDGDTEFFDQSDSLIEN